MTSVCGPNIFVNGPNVAGSVDSQSNGYYSQTAAKQGPDADCVQFSGQRRQKKTLGGKIKDFFSGMGSAAMGLFSVKGLLMAAGSVALGLVMPWTIPLMIGGTLLASGYGMAKSFASGDYKSAGENAFGFLAAGFGARSFAGENVGMAARGDQGIFSKIWQGKWTGEEGVTGHIKAWGQQSYDGVKNIPQRAKAEFTATTRGSMNIERITSPEQITQERISKVPSEGIEELPEGNFRQLLQDAKQRKLTPEELQTVRAGFAEDQIISPENPMALPQEKGWTDVSFNDVKTDAQNHAKEVFDKGFWKSSWTLVKQFFTGTMPSTAIQVEVGAHNHLAQFNADAANMV
jgi:hypothetical protein